MEVQEIIRGGGFAPFDGQVLRIDGTCVRPYAVTDTRKLSVSCCILQILNLTTIG